MRSIFPCFAALALISISAETAFSFAEMVKHGYVQCTSCHVSTNGGEALLTTYGRSLSNEILSTFGKEGESDLAYGLATPPEWLRIGANIRTNQTYVETPKEKRGAFFPMQAEMAIGIDTERWVAVASGAIEGDKNQKTKNYISPYHYLMYRQPEMFHILTGKKDIPYGLNIPDHVAYIKNDIRFGPGLETYLTEAGFLMGPIEFYLDALMGGPDSTKGQPEKGGLITMNYVGFDTSKLGLSFLSGRDDISKRTLAGIYGIVDLTHGFLYMFEFDQQVLKLDGAVPEQKGHVTFNRLKYEAVQGAWIFLTHQVSHLNSEVELQKRDSQGIGLQWFPRPHFDILVEYYKEKDPALFPDYTDKGWFILHAYL